MMTSFGFELKRIDSIDERVDSRRKERSSGNTGAGEGQSVSVGGGASRQRHRVRRETRERESLMSEHSQIWADQVLEGKECDVTGDGPAGDRRAES